MQQAQQHEAHTPSIRSLPMPLHTHGCPGPRPHAPHYIDTRKQGAHSQQGKPVPPAPAAAAAAAASTAAAAAAASTAAAAAAASTAAAAPAAAAAAAASTAAAAAAAAAASTAAASLNQPAVLPSRPPHTHPLCAKPTARVKLFQPPSLSPPREVARLYPSSSSGDTAAHSFPHTSAMSYQSAVHAPSTAHESHPAARPPFAAAAAAAAPRAWLRPPNRLPRSLPLYAAAAALPTRRAVANSLRAFESGASHSAQSGLAGHYVRWAREDGGCEREHQRREYFRHLERHAREWVEEARRQGQRGSEGQGNPSWPIRPPYPPPPHSPLRDPATLPASSCSSPSRPLGLVAAHSLHDLMVIRALHSALLRLPRHSLGTALGIRTRAGQLTSVPAIIVFVSCKVHQQWVPEGQLLPRQLVGPTGVWCDVDVVEFCYTDAPVPTCTPYFPPPPPSPDPPVTADSPEAVNVTVAVAMAHADGAAAGVGVGFGFPNPGASQEVGRGGVGSARESQGGASERGAHSSRAAPLDEMTGGVGEVGPGSQVASEGTYGTLTAVVVSTRGEGAVGVVTNRHVAVDLNQPQQALHHPLPPSHGPGVLLGLVERAVSFVSDCVWYGMFATPNTEAYVRVDAAFVPFHPSLDVSIITPALRGLGAVGPPCDISLHDAIGSIINRPVCKVGATSGVTRGRIMGYAVEYNDDRGRTLFTDFLILGEHGQPFDQKGDSGSLILAMPTREGGSTEGRDRTDGDSVLRPIGVIWGGTANQGRLKLRRGHAPENWTSAVDVGRLLRLLDLRMITTPEELRALVVEHPNSFSTGVEVFSCDYGEPSGF
ncbi:hypothetical protein CLOP_g25657 [Closterium sp. NIES-67]|nr:hypothetical protein CLOP_g25657 [Closterium sp. NIES-67]